MLWQNPAWVASTRPHDAQMVYRHRAPRLDGGVSQFYNHYTHSWYASRLAAGAWASIEQAGAGRFRQQSFGLVMGSWIRLSEQWCWRFALEGSYLQQQHGFSQYVFGDQLSAFGNTGNPSAEPFPDEQLHSWNIGAGSVWHHPAYWLSFSVRYLNRAQLKNSSIPYRLPIYWQIQAGIRIETELLQQSVQWIPWIQYRRYDQYQTIDAGILLYLDPLWIGFSSESLRLGRSPIQQIGIQAGFSHEIYHFIYHLGIPSSKNTLPGFVHELGIHLRIGDSFATTYRRSLLQAPFQVY